jgi:hypothetical protein
VPSTVLARKERQTQCKSFDVKISKFIADMQIFVGKKIIETEQKKYKYNL